MPTNDERREYRYGYDPRGPARSQQQPSRFGGVWDSVRSEMSALAGSPVGPGRAVTGIARDVTGLVKKIPAAAQSIANTYGLAMEDLSGMHSDDDTRQRRMAQAGIQAPSQMVPAHAANRPVMSESARGETQPRSTGIMADPKAQDGGLGAGPGSKPPISEASTKSRASGTVSASGGSVPLSPSDQEYLNRPAVNVDPRKRYYDMAGISLEQRNAMLDAMPEGQRPIQTIRGNREGWYNPALSREFSGISEALTGVEGRPTYKSESAREEEALDRGMAARIAESRNKTLLAAEGMRQSGSDRRHEPSGKGKGEGWDTFVQKGVDETGNPVEKTLVWNKALGPHTIIEPKHTPAKAIASAILGDWQNEKARDGWLPMFEYLDANKVAEIATTMPPDVREYYRTKLKEKASKKKEK